MAFNGTSSSDPSSGWDTSRRTLVLLRGSLAGRRVELSNSYPLERSTSVVRVFWVPDWLENLDETIKNNGRRVGMQADIIPVEDSTIHQVQAFPSVQAISVGLNSKRVVKR